MKRYRYPGQTATASPMKDVSPFSRIVTTHYAGNVVFAPPVNRQEQFLRASDMVRDEILSSKQNVRTDEKKES